MPASPLPNSPSSAPACNVPASTLANTHAPIAPASPSRDGVAAHAPAAPADRAGAGAEARALLLEEFGELRGDTSQLKQVLRDSIARLNHGFLGMTEQVRSQGTVLCDILSLVNNPSAGTGATDSDFKTFTRETERILQVFVDQVIKTSEESMTLVQKVGDVSTRMDEVVTHVSGVRRIAEETRMLALNASIQAALAGDAGRAFNVVASAVKELANSSRSFGDRISSSVGKAREDMVDAREVVKHMASADMTFAIEAKLKVDSMLQAVERVNAEVATKAQEAQGIGQKFGSTVGTAISALQFEDILAQLVDHMIGIIDRLETLAVQIAAPTDSSVSAAERARVLEVVAAHRSHGSANRRKAVEQQSMQTGSIELF
jgi:methyl-accepting chemotaxis protein